MLFYKLLIGLILQINTPMDIHQYLKKIFFDAPVEMEADSVIQFLKGVKGLSYKETMGSYSAMGLDGSEMKTKFKSFNFDSHPYILMGNGKSEIHFTYSSVNNIDGFKSMDIDFNFRSKDSA